jgi:hypothetical protein
LACGKEDDIEFLFQGIGERTLLDMIQRKLLHHGGPPSPQLDGVILQALYVAVNISTGGVKHKNAVLFSEAILHRVLHYMVIVRGAREKFLDKRINRVLYRRTRNL